MVITLVGPMACNVSGMNIAQLFILGTMKDIVLTYIGFIFFDDSTMTTTLATGLALSFAGAVLYPLDYYLKDSKKKLNELEKKNKQE